MSALPERSKMVLVVVGASLQSEVMDRPMAYRLADAIRSWRSEHASQLTTMIEPVVCTDVWYLNDETLHAKPVISLGGPDSNALSAAFAQNAGKAPSGDPEVWMQFDPEYTDLQACVWGHGPRADCQGC